MNKYDYILTYGNTKIAYSAAVDMWKDILINGIYPVEITTDGITRQIISATADDLPIVEVVLSVRAHHILRRAGCYTIGDVARQAKEQGFTDIPNCGKKTRHEIYTMLEKLYMSSEYQYYAARDDGYTKSQGDYWAEQWYNEDAMSFAIQD